MQASGLNLPRRAFAPGSVSGHATAGREKWAGRIVRVARTWANSRWVKPGASAIAPNSFCDYLTVPCKAVVEVPDGLSLDEAATIPIAFLTASIALFEIGQLQCGSRVLIHSATGGVGLAAIRLAQSGGGQRSSPRRARASTRHCVNSVSSTCMFHDALALPMES